MDEVIVEITTEEEQVEPAQSDINLDFLISGLPLSTHILEIRKSVGQLEMALNVLNEILRNQMVAEVAKQVAEDPETALEYQRDIVHIIAKPWHNQTYLAGAIVSDEGQYYRAIQNVGIGQAHFRPSEALSLWRIWDNPAEEEWPVWRQPLDQFDAYKIGARVTHNNKKWMCSLGDGAGNNVWEPGIYGWDLIEELTTSETEEPETEEPQPPAIEAWQQRHSAPYYQVGDRVTHKGKTWECTAGDGSGNNSWEPGVYGWTEVI